jgi:hypothetical protein
MRFDLRKLRVRQPELIPIHPCFLSETVNHNTLIMPTLLWVRALMTAWANYCEPKGGSNIVKLVQQRP